MSTAQGIRANRERRTIVLPGDTLIDKQVFGNEGRSGVPALSFSLAIALLAYGLCYRKGLRADRRRARSLSRAEPVR